MQLLSIQIPERSLVGIDLLVLNGSFPNRSEAIRAAVREMVEKEFGSYKELIRYQYMAQGPKIGGSESEDGNNL